MPPRKRTRAAPTQSSGTQRTRGQRTGATATRTITINSKTNIDKSHLLTHESRIKSAPIRNSSSPISQSPVHQSFEDGISVGSTSITFSPLKTRIQRPGILLSFRRSDYYRNQPQLLIGTTIVPPSDDEEYEQWSRAQAQQREEEEEEEDEYGLSSPGAGPSRLASRHSLSIKQRGGEDHKSEESDSDATTSTVLRFTPFFSSQDYDDSVPFSEGEEFESLNTIRSVATTSLLDLSVSRKGKGKEKDLLQERLSPVDGERVRKAITPVERPGLSQSCSPDPLAFSQDVIHQASPISLDHQKQPPSQSPIKFDDPPEQRSSPSLEDPPDIHLSSPPLPNSHMDFSKRSPPSEEFQNRPRSPPARDRPRSPSPSLHPPPLFSLPVSSPIVIIQSQPPLHQSQSQIHPQTPPQVNSHTSTSPSQSIPSFRTRPAPSSPIPPAPLPVVSIIRDLSPSDPLLEAFRSARTFRTRTALQLQPYTKERQSYERALRLGRIGRAHKGGLAAVVESAEVGRDEEEDVSESSEAEEEHDDDESTTAHRSRRIGSEAIAIGATPPTRLRRRLRSPLKLVDEDYDEYYFEHGIAADEDDPSVAAILQKIARKRLKLAKDERKRKKEAEKAKRDFEKLLKERERKKAGLQVRQPLQEKPQVQERRESDHGQTRIRTNGPAQPRNAIKTYRGQRNRRDREQYKQPRQPNSPSRHSSPSREDSLTPLDSPSPATHDDEPVVDHVDYGDFVDYDQGSLLVKDIPRSTSRRKRILSSSSHSHDSSSNPSEQSDEDKDEDAEMKNDKENSGMILHDKRAKIARRMLPVAMLKRLEQEAREKDTKRLEAKRQRTSRHMIESPVRPGRAIVKRGAGPVNFDEMLDLFDDDEEEETSDITYGLSLIQPKITDHLMPSRRDAAIVISSDSNDDEEEEEYSSEAMEDNREIRGQRCLAQLQKGAFEDIITGRRIDRDRARIRQHQLQLQRPRNQQEQLSRQSKQKPKRHRRPAMGLVTQTRQPISTIGRPLPLMQTHLDFPAATKLSFKFKNRDVEKASRPAIRLKDNIIFTQSDFAFDYDDKERELEREKDKGKEKRPAQTATTTTKMEGALPNRRDDNRFLRTLSKPGLIYQPQSPRMSSPNQTSIQPHLDDGVGRARSWANFDRFPIDFDISPLPSGVFCATSTIAGGGRLTNLLDLLNNNQIMVNSISNRTCFGIELSSDTPSDEFLTVLPIIFDRLYTSILTFTINRESVLDLISLEHFNDLISQKFGQEEGVVTAVSEVVRSTLEKIDQMVVSENRQDRPLAEQLLLIRWYLTELAIRLNVLQNDHDLVIQTCGSLLESLFTFGFDKTIKPLKSIIRGDVETPEIKDLSVSLWVSILHVLKVYDKVRESDGDTFAFLLNKALDSTYRNDQIGPLAAERLWYIIFGLCALSQFGSSGTIVSGDFCPTPRWNLVKRAIGLIKVTHNQEAEELAHIHQLQGRDRYIKVMVARCLRLSSIWKWHFDRDSFSITTKDLGMVFKNRQHRNLPTEPPVDFPEFITKFDISLTAKEDDDTNMKRKSAFELYLRLSCVAASDLISSSTIMEEAKQAEKDVQRLIMSIFPLSSVSFTRIRPPTRKQLGALINRYSTMIIACYFSPSLLPWLLANSRKWINFESADLESRQIVIRGLMYLAVACRHHDYPLDLVVQSLADVLGVLQRQLESLDVGSGGEDCGGLSAIPTRLEIERTMVLVVTSFRQIITRHSFDVQAQTRSIYPDPALLHESWTAKIFELDLAKDMKAGLEIIATIQAFLDARSQALPSRARRAREAKISESFDSYPSLGFDFDTVDLIALGGVVDGGGVDEEEGNEDPVEKKDAEFAQIILNIICPKIYRLLSDLLPVNEVDLASSDRADRQVFLTKLTKCWSDCAGIVVVEHQLQDWSSYIGPFGSQSWSRLGNEYGRIQVGLHFMLNVAQLDPCSFRSYEEEFISLFFQTIVVDRLTVEHKFVSAVLGMPGALEHPLLAGVDLVVGVKEGLDRDSFLLRRGEILDYIFGNISNLLGSKFTPPSMKPFIYRCVNLLVSSLISNEKAIDKNRILHRETYHVFADTTVRSLLRAASDFITPLSVPGLKAFI